LKCRKKEKKRKSKKEKTFFLPSFFSFFVVQACSESPVLVLVLIQMTACHATEVLAAVAVLLV